MIPLRFGLFWAGDTLSYLRYLTFKSLRHYHPDAKIQLYLTKEYNKDKHHWSCEGQDFEKPLDYMNIIGLEIKKERKNIRSIIRNGLKTIDQK